MNFQLLIWCYRFWTFSIYDSIGFRQKKKENTFVSKEKRGKIKIYPAFFHSSKKTVDVLKEIWELKPIIFYIWKWFERVSFALKVKIIFESTKAYNETIHTFIHRMTNHKIWIQIKWLPFVFSVTHCVWFCLWVRKSFIQ